MVFRKGVKHSEETRRKMSIAKKKYYETHTHIPVNKGVPHKPETVEKIRKSCIKSGVGKWNKGKHYNIRRNKTDNNTDGDKDNQG